MTKHIFGVRGETTLLDGRPFLAKGLRLSNALASDSAVAELTGNLDLFASYGVNTISVFWQGSRFGDVKGYREDASLDPLLAARFGRIIEAADERAMVVLVGCLYWSNSKAKWESWTQKEANLAIANTVRWLKEHDYRNTFVDVDNEGMAQYGAGFDDRQLVLAAKAVDPTIMVATNYKEPPPEVDLAVHHSQVAPGKPYIESEGSPPVVPYGRSYWAEYSKAEGFYGYVNVGVYTDEMKASQIEATRQHLASGKGYLLASTWLQAGPPQGPLHRPGGYGRVEDPGVLWWLEWLKGAYGPYRP